jgi:Mg-chelatase subunit ChlD
MMMNGNKTLKMIAVLALVGLAVVLIACAAKPATQAAVGAEEPVESLEEAPAEDKGGGGETAKSDSADAGAVHEEAEAPAAAEPAIEGGYGGGGESADEASRSGAASGAPAAMPTMAAAGAEGVYPPESFDNAATVPDEQFQVSLQAGEIDDNADFGAYLQYRLDFQRFLGGTIVVHDVEISERHTIRVTGSDGLPVLGAEVLVYDGQSLVTALRTPATGVVYFFPRAYPAHAGADAYTVMVSKDRSNTEFRLTRGNTDAVWDVQLDTQQARQQVQLDVLFLIDSTGSMSPQIEQLKENMLSISAQIEALPSSPDTQFGMVTYRDRGDAFVTEVFNFTSNVRKFQNELDKVFAAGGGDTPESMNEGLHRAVADVDWRVEDTVSLIILVADAPPHLDYAQDYDYAQEMQNAAELGIKIFPIMADTGVTGFDRDQAEYVFRQLSQFTGGHFIFVTSKETPKSTGEEGTDLSVQEEAYSVENLDALVVRLIQQELAALSGAQ